LNPAARPRRLICRVQLDPRVHDLCERARGCLGKSDSIRATASSAGSTPARVIERKVSRAFSSWGVCCKVSTARDQKQRSDYPICGDESQKKECETDVCEKG